MEMFVSYLDQQLLLDFRALIAEHVLRGLLSFLKDGLKLEVEMKANTAYSLIRPDLPDFFLPLEMKSLASLSVCVQACCQSSL